MDGEPIEDELDYQIPVDDEEEGQPAVEPGTREQPSKQ
jgi:hypothetical protein